MATEARYVMAGSRRLPDCLHGNKNNRKKGEEHPHAFWLPQDLDEDGFIDHILVYAHNGIDPAAIRTLAGCHRLEVEGLGQWDLMPEWMGHQEQTSLFQSGKIWQSSTPWFPLPKEELHRLQAIEQMERELEYRGFPKAKITILTELQAAEIQKTPHNHNGRKPNPDIAPCLVQIAFETEITAPLALGFAAHFGLGQFILSQSK